jgi:hypothetical protein
MNKYFKVILCLFCVITIKVQADFAAAVKNYGNKKFPEAMHEFQSLAALGHKQSQLNIGAMYFRGESVEKNLIDAYVWVALSAEDGNADSIRTKDIIFSKMDAQQKIRADIQLKQLALSYGSQALSSTLYPKHSAERIKIIYTRFKAAPRIPSSAISEKIAKFELEYDVDPQGYIHNYTFLSEEGIKDSNKLITYLASLKNYPQRLDGKPISAYNIELTFIQAGNGRGNQLIDEANKELREGFQPEIDWSDADNLYRHAIRVGDSPISVKMQQHKTLLLLSAAQMGHPKAQAAIALHILYGHNFDQDRKKGLAWLLAAAKSEDNSSLYLAASILYDGILVDLNKRKAIEFLQKAATQNHTKSKMKLAWILATEKDTEFFNPSKALELVTDIYSSYLDRVTAFETLAAAQAANKLFDNAVSSQESAISVAENIDARLEEALICLKTYKQHEAWRQ